MNTRPYAKRILIIILCMTTLFLTNACIPADYGQMPTRPSQKAATTTLAPTAEPTAATDGELSGELTITAFSDFLLKPAAKAFMELHPKVTIHIESYPINQQIPEKTYAAQGEKFVYQTVTSLMSGTPSDLICLYDATGALSFILLPSELFFGIH